MLLFLGPISMELYSGLSKMYTGKRGKQKEFYYLERKIVAKIKYILNLGKLLQ